MCGVGLERCGGNATGNVTGNMTVCQALPCTDSILMSESQKWESQSRALKIAWGAMLLNEDPHGWRGAFFGGAQFLNWDA